MIEHDHEVLRVAVAAGAVAEPADTAVVALECGVGESVLGPREHAGEVAVEHGVEADERREPRLIDVNYSCRSATTILAGRATRVVDRPPRPSGGRRERLVERSRVRVHLVLPFEGLG